jgi:hypothetical protein
MRPLRTEPAQPAPVAILTGDEDPPPKGKRLFYFRLIFYFLPLLALTTEFGCSKSPVAPARAMALNLSIPITPELKNSLLGTTTNSLHYRVDGSGGVSLIESTTGPFSAPVSYGSVDFTLDIPPGGKVLSLELDSYRVLRGLALESPLALGAVGLDFINGGTGNVTVEMGSITRTCYNLDELTNGLGGTGAVYGFATDTLFNQLAMGPQYDIAILQTGTGYSFADGQNVTPTLKSIAYLGNGDLLDYDRVPPDSSFFTTSTQAKGGAVSIVESGDIYCFKLSTMPGFAWAEITDAGLFVAGAPGSYGPSFEFRTNQTKPYYAYDETAADSGNTCSTTW